MSELRHILPNEIWHEIVAFYPLENVVKAPVNAVNVLDLFRKDRYIQIKKWRNHLLYELLTLWCLSCACQDRRNQAPKGSAIQEQITAEYLEIRGNVRQKMAQLFHIIKLPWPFQECGVGVSRQLGKPPTLMIWKREGLFFETANVEEGIKYLEDEIEIEELDEDLIALTWNHTYEIKID